MKNVLVQILFTEKLNGIFFPRSFQEVEGILAFIFQKFLHEVTFKYFWREILRGSHFEFFVQIVVRGNAVQIVPNFPAKSLSIYRANFLFTPF